MFGLLRRLFGKTGPATLPEQAGGDAKPAPGLIRNTIGMTIDLDRFGPGDRKSLDQEIIRRAGVALFHGTVEHAYSRSAVGATDRCPRCHAPAQPHCAHFIYATDRGTRVMLAPAEFFCTACPTVIIDQAQIAAAVKPRFKFQRVVGIEDPDRRKPNPFRTWNGKKAIYVLDENDQCLGLETVDEAVGPPRPLGRQQPKRKRKPARKRHRRR